MKNVSPFSEMLLAVRRTHRKIKNGFAGNSPDYSTYLIKEVKLFIYDTKECTF
jgi:hypothetical protein